MKSPAAISSDIAPPTASKKRGFCSLRMRVAPAAHRHDGVRML